MSIQLFKNDSKVFLKTSISSMKINKKKKINQHILFNLKYTLKGTF